MKNVKKYIYILILSIITFAAAAVCSYADGDTTSYYITEAAMTVDVPSSVSVATVGIKENDELFTSGLFDYVEVMEDFRDSSVYLLGKDYAVTYKIVISVTEDSGSTEYGSFKNLTDDTKAAITESLSSQSSVIACNTYETDEAFYYETIMQYTEDNAAYYVKQYYTVVNGKNISISLVSYTGELTTDENNIIRQIAGSARFDIEESGLSTATVVCLAIAAFVVVAAAFTAAFMYYRKRLKLSAPAPSGSASKPINTETPKAVEQPISEHEAELKEEEEETDILLDFLTTDKEREEAKEKEEAERKAKEEAEQKAREEAALKAEAEAEKAKQANAQTSGNDNSNTITEDYSVIESIFDTDKTNDDKNTSEASKTTADPLRDTIDIPMDGILNTDTAEDDEEFNSDLVEEPIVAENEELSADTAKAPQSSGGAAVASVSDKILNIPQQKESAESKENIGISAKQDTPFEERPSTDDDIFDTDDFFASDKAEDSVTAQPDNIADNTGSETLSNAAQDNNETNVPAAEDKAAYSTEKVSAQASDDGDAAILNIFAPDTDKEKVKEDYSSVDIAAAIAYFEEDIAAEKARKAEHEKRELARGKKKKGLFSSKSKDKKRK